jgi:threonine dehydrogenase-like Zn-dependent dehydrogenase
MKALEVEGPGKARVVHVDEPDAIADGVLLQVRRVGLCGTDLNTFRGRNPMVTFPRILGHEVAATVVGVNGESDATLKPGTDVTLSPYTACGHCASCRRGRSNACEFNQTLGVQRDGAMTQKLRYEAKKLYPAALNLSELCLVEPLTVGFHAVARGRIAAGETVAVIGCGGVGLGAISGASFRGARVIAIDRDEAKLELACRAGASETIHSGKESLQDRLFQLTDGRGPDCIIEAVGLPETFRAAVELVAFTGRVVYIGYAKEPVAYETKLFVQKELDILGTRNALPENFKEVIRMLEEKRFPVPEAISAVVSMDEAPEMLRQWSEDPTRFTKILVDIS